MSIANGLPWLEYLKLEYINASLLVHANKSWKQFQWVRQHGFQPKTDTRIGTALHSLVELLPVEKFQDLYHIMPDFARSPENVTDKGAPSTSPNTTWAKSQRETFQAEHDGLILDRTEHKRALRMLESIQANSHAMELIDESRKEVTVTGELNGVMCKGRLDGLRKDGFWDLKSTNNIAAHRFGKTAADLGYLFKLAFYWRLLDINGDEPEEVDLIAVQDPKPRADGQWNEAPDCCVYSVPLVAIENQMQKVERLLEEFKECERSGVWPGCPDGELVVPLWAMEESELVD